MRVQVSMCAFVGFALSLYNGALAKCDTGDTFGCVPFKYVKCESNILDINFVLDRSGSMSWGMNDNGVSSGQLCQYEYPQVYKSLKTTCFRQDIMRFVLRDVLKEIFLLYQRDCLEYLQSESARVGGDCAARGFTTTRINILWWQSKNGGSERYLGEEFTPKTTSLHIGKSFKSYFYNDADGTILPDKWETTNGVVKMKDEEIDFYFKNVLLKGSTKSGFDENNDLDPYPYGAGGTLLYYGLKKMHEILGDIFNSYTETQKSKARFPIFVMTDGELSGGDRSAEWAKKLKETTGNPSQVDIYGLGLTGANNGRLKAEQVALYKRLDFIDEITVPTNTGKETVELYFNDAATAKKVISAIFQSVNEGCKDCYELDNEVKCVELGQPVPSFGTNTANDIPEEPDNVPDSALTVGIATFTNSYDSFVGIGNDIFKIPKNTTLCENYYPGGFAFTNYENGTCQCCETLSQPCLCSFADSPVTGTKTITVGTGATAYDLEISVYDQTSTVAAELTAISSLKVTDTLSTQGGSSINDGEETTDDDDDRVYEDDVVFTPVVDRDDDNIDSTDDESVVEKPDLINESCATRIVSLIGLVALSMMAAII